MKMYHITNMENLESILEEGIKCNADGEIFVFENKSIHCNGITNFIADMIARNQIFLKEYIMIEIDENAFESELIPDDVAELCHKQQWYVKQEIIAPEFLNHYGTYKTKYKEYFYN